MNPNGLFTPKAQEAARKQYLSNLKLQQANIDYNLNANRIYKETQQISKPTDTRTADERLADIESLKQFVREALDFTKNAGNIVNDLDNSELQYVAQNINRVINEINKRFAVGLTSGKLSEKSTMMLSSFSRMIYPKPSQERERNFSTKSSQEEKPSTFSARTCRMLSRAEVFMPQAAMDSTFHRVALLEME